MKRYLIGNFIFFTCVISLSKAVSAVEVPATFYDNLTIAEISSWPNTTYPDQSITVRLQQNIPMAGCNNTNLFAIKAGDYQQQSLSLLLAAFMSGNKKVKIRVVECTDRPMVDRVSIY